MVVDTHVACCVDFWPNISKEFISIAAVVFCIAVFKCAKLTSSSATVCSRVSARFSYVPNVLKSFISSLVDAGIAVPTNAGIR